MTRRGIGLGVAAVLVMAVAGASGDPKPAAPPQRKPVPSRFAKAAGNAYAQAMAADDRGDLATALAFYRKANAIAPHPDTTYNVADLQRRLGNYDAAIASFYTYLDQAPTAADRAAVTATIRALEATPTTLQLFGGVPTDPKSLEIDDLYVIVDGAIASRPGAKLTTTKEFPYPVNPLAVSPGYHVVEVVSPITYGITACRTSGATPTMCTPEAKPRVDGNLVFGVPDGDLRVIDPASMPTPPVKDHAVWYYALDEHSLARKRVQVTPGKHRFAVLDREHECPAISVTVSADPHVVTYVALSSAESSGLLRCRKLVVRQDALTFAP